MAEGVSTSMDQLIGLLSSKGFIKITDAARDLNTDKSHIESWAKMLEKEGIVQVHYSVIGGAVIKKGPKFDTVTKGPAKSGITAEKPKPIEASQVEIKPKQPMPGPKSAPEEYLFIRKKIEDEGQTFKEDLQKLAVDQGKIIEGMTMLIQEGRKLEEYIENLQQVVERVNEKRDETLSSVTKGKR